MFCIYCTYQIWSLSLLTDELNQQTLAPPTEGPSCSVEDNKLHVEKNSTTEANDGSCGDNNEETQPKEEPAEKAGEYSYLRVTTNDSDITKATFIAINLIIFKCRDTDAWPVVEVKTILILTGDNHTGEEKAPESTAPSTLVDATDNEVDGPKARLNEELNCVDTNTETPEGESRLFRKLNDCTISFPSSFLFWGSHVAQR